MDSILLTIKKMLGLDASYEVFDQELVIFINSALMVLEQVGLGPNGFAITGVSETWDQFLTDISKFEGVKTYVYIKTRLSFDPPTNASLLKSFEDAAKELEWRLNVKSEHEHGYVDSY